MSIYLYLPGVSKLISHESLSNDRRCLPGIRSAALYYTENNGGFRTIERTRFGSVNIPYLSNCIVIGLECYIMFNVFDFQWRA